jgi:hypothetical protein
MQSILHGKLPAFASRGEHRMSDIRVYSINDLVERGIGSRRKIYDLIRDGKLTARKHGARNVVLEDDLRRYLSDLPVIQREIAAS